MVLDTDIIYGNMDKSKKYRLVVYYIKSLL